MKANPPAPARMTAVTRKPRRQWKIPPMPRAVVGSDDADAEARRRAFLRSTTPLGREILRKILFRVERVLDDPDASIDAAVTTLENELETFSALRPEFAVMFGQLWAGAERVASVASSRSLATLVVLRLRASQYLEHPSDGNVGAARSPGSWRLLL